MGFRTDDSMAGKKQAPETARKEGKMMKKLLTGILCLCLLLSAAAYAEEENNDTTLLKIWDESGLEISYLRFDFYVGAEYRGFVCTCPDEGEDFYRCPVSVQSAEELKDLKIKCSYGVSDLEPEDAILQVMMGKEMEEHEIGELEMELEEGQEYEMRLAAEEDGTYSLTMKD